MEEIFLMRNPTESKKQSFYSQQLYLGFTHFLSAATSFFENQSQTIISLKHLKHVMNVFSSYFSQSSHD